MNKRGYQLITNKTLGIIISVACLVILIGFAVSYIHTYIASNDALKQAKTTLNNLVDVINSGGIQFVGLEPYQEGGNPWFIASYAKPSALPKQCQDAGWQSCLCICQAGCDSLGICQDNDFSVSTLDNLFMITKVPYTVSIDQKTKTLTVSYS